jgi:hypothetical protein
MDAGFAGVTTSTPNSLTPVAVAMIATDVSWPTGDVVATKLAELAPAGTVTLAGTLTAAFPDVSETTKPPAGAGLVRSNVPVAVEPPPTAAGAKVISAGAASFAVMLAVIAEPLSVDVTVAVWSLDTVVVVMLNDTAVLPAAMLTADGTFTAALLLVTGMTKPPAGAGSEIVSLAVAVNPPVPLLGVTSRAVGTIGRIVSVPLADTLLAVAVIVTSFCAVTACVETLNVASVAPARTVTVAGTVAPAPPT